MFPLHSKRVTWNNAAELRLKAAMQRLIAIGDCWLKQPEVAVKVAVQRLKQLKVAVKVAERRLRATKSLL